MSVRPNPQEVEFLDNAYNFFLDIYDEVKEDSFWGKDSYYRFSRVRDTFLVYSELLDYEPIGWFLAELKKLRPPMEAELSTEYILFIRNLLIHFPFFKSWDEVRFTSRMINWSKPGKSIDKFLSRFSGHEVVKYRMWNQKDQTMTYITIRFPDVYPVESETSLKELMPEKEGVLFTMSLMHQVLMSQVESVRAGTE